MYVYVCIYIYIYIHVRLEGEQSGSAQLGAWLKGTLQATAVLSNMRAAETGKQQQTTTTTTTTITNNDNDKNNNDNNNNHKQQICRTNHTGSESLGTYPHILEPHPPPTPFLKATHGTPRRPGVSARAEESQII